MKKIALKLKILQEVSNEQRTREGLPKLGKGYFSAIRLNPYNPLSYIFYALFVLGKTVSLFFESVFETLCYNPFKWD